MARITVVEHGLDAELYDALVVVSARLGTAPASTIRASARSAGRCVTLRNWRTGRGHVVVFVDAHFAETTVAVGGLVTTSVTVLKRKSKQRRTAVIRGPGERVLSRVELNDEA